MMRSNFSSASAILGVLAVSILSACTGSASSSASGAGGGATTASDPLEPLTTCIDDDIKDNFAGPGYDATQGGLLPPVQASYVAATTVLLQSSDPAKQMAFAQAAGPVIGDLPKMPGLIGYQLGISGKCHYARTLTVWKDMGSMMSFVTSPNHAHAMTMADQVSAAGAVTNWEIQSSDFPPTWAMARDEISKTGRSVY
jgi:hypothetical protein